MHFHLAIRRYQNLPAIAFGGRLRENCRRVSVDMPAPLHFSESAFLHSNVGVVLLTKSEVPHEVNIAWTFVEGALQTQEHFSVQYSAPSHDSQRVRDGHECRVEGRLRVQCQ